MLTGCTFYVLVLSKIVLKKYLNIIILHYLCIMSNYDADKAIDLHVQNAAKAYARMKAAEYDIQLAIHREPKSFVKYRETYEDAAQKFYHASARIGRSPTH